MIVLTKARLLVNGQLQQAEIAFDEKIRAIGRDLDGDEKIDCSGKIILPGVIDVHVHARDFKQAHKEDWLSLGRSAIAGGVTTVFAMPNTDPPLTTVERVLEYRRRAENSLANAKIYGGIAPDNIQQLASLAPSVDAFKLYLGETTGQLVISDRRLHRKIFKIIAQTGKILAVHAQRGDVVPEIVTQHESDDICYVLDLAARFETRLHVVHVTTRRGVEAILEAKKSKIDVTFETCPHYLFFSAQDHRKRGAWLKMNPPLATEEDREYLWYALQKGLIDIVATDHAPHTVAEKSVGYGRAPAGVPGVEFLPPLLLDAMHREKFSLTRLVEVCSLRPAQRFGLATGELRSGLAADITVIDTQREKTISRADVLSKCGWSPYEGFSLRGWPVMTFVRGQSVSARLTPQDSATIRPYSSD